MEESQHAWNKDCGGKGLTCRWDPGRVQYWSFHCGQLSRCMTHHTSWVHSSNTIENCHNLIINMLSSTGSHIEWWHQFWRTCTALALTLETVTLDEYHTPGWVPEDWHFMIMSFVWFWLSALIDLSRRLCAFVWQSPHTGYEYVLLTSLLISSLHQIVFFYRKNRLNKYGLNTLTWREDEELWNNNTETFFWGQREREAYSGY